MPTFRSIRVNRTTFRSSPGCAATSPIAATLVARSFVADSDAAVDRAVPVRIELYPRARDWTYSFGLGYATDTGARIRVDADNNLFNERGHRVAVKSVLSTERNSLDLQYRIPHLSPLNDWFTFDTGIAHLESNTSTSDIERVGARHSYEQGAWIETDFVDLTYEDFKIGDEFGDSRLVLFGSTLTRFWRDIPSRPNAGYRVEWNDSWRVAVARFGYRRRSAARRRQGDPRAGRKMCV